ncbi:DUF1761 domain-containing protein [candidate division KSB1 bacterium]|nr:MAG: DUF1761 domain-containing protein [candidate division KSB1 bacterium]MBC6949932.1 DUF1761 domain-containing protein [candidate division KSB1 bacterium]MCE7944602.1 DUF1761 domain-containing protein [Chlorobi bacterium CHB1]MDL1875640.1 DUF1761 domain-containing protein [Cytophagia bacterium CHB2]RIK70200.1 MAG: DUF1761 domain-containing protein [candidate division KSB1 bacterium]
MQTRKFIGAWAAYVAITFCLGFVWHLVLFKDLYHELAIFSRIDNPIIPLGFSAMLIQGAVLSYAYRFFPQRHSSVLNGIKFGLLAGVFIASSAVIAEAAKQNVTSLSIWLLVETVYYLLQFGLSGFAIGLIFGGVTKIF